VFIRPIRPSDKPLLVSGLSAMSRASVHARFLSPRSSFTAAELRYLTEVDGYDHVALVAVEGDELLAVARFIRDPQDDTSAEVGVMVCDHLQGQGLGTLLGLALAEEARAVGVQHFTAIMLPDNVAALRLFARISAHLHTELHDGVRELVADLAA